MNAQYKKGFVYFICLVSAMGGLLFGYDWVVIGGAKPFYEPYFGITDDNTMRAVAMSVALLGCLVGAMIAGVLADKYGRKRLLIVAALVFFFFAKYRHGGLFCDFCHIAFYRRDSYWARSRCLSYVYSRDCTEKCEGQAGFTQSVNYCAGDIVSSNRQYAYRRIGRS